MNSINQNSVEVREKRLQTRDGSFLAGYERRWPIGVLEEYEEEGTFELRH